MESSRTLKGKSSGIEPGTFDMASSPSHVLHSHPFREIFCTHPVRYPSEYDQLSATHVQSANASAGTRTSATTNSFHREARRRRGGGGSWSATDRKSTSELQSRLHLVCRLLLEKKNTQNK